jgi:hypothetical protein
MNYAFQPNMETYKQEPVSEVCPVSPHSDSDLSDLGKDGLLFPNVYPVVKIEVKVSMYVNVAPMHHLKHSLIHLYPQMETFAITCL